MIRFFVASLTCLIGGFGVLGAEPGTWPQFRGPGALGVAEGKAPPTAIGPDKNVLWKVPVPLGVSSPVVWKGKLFLTGIDQGKLFTLAYDLATGKEIWRAEAPAKKIEAYHKTEGSPAASTVVTDGQKLVAYFGSAGIFAYDFTGKELWRHEMPKAETSFDFGTGVSPVIADGLVVLARDLKTDSRLMVLDLNTGSKVWEKKREGFPTSWSTPAIWDTPTGKQIVLPGYGKMVGYDLKSSDEKWFVQGMPSACCTTPIIHEGNLVFAGWSPGEDFKLPSFAEILKEYDTDGDGRLSKKEAEKSMIGPFFDNNDPNKDGFITKEEWEANSAFMAKANNSAFILKPGGTGDVTKNLVWRVKKGLPYVPSPLVYQGQIYMVNMRGQLSAYDIKTGKDVYLEENVGLTSCYASPVAANGNIYLFGLDKSAIVIKAGDVPVNVSKAKLDDRIAATPAIVDGVIYVRTNQSLYAFGTK